jgi:hypothetical protein
MTTKTQPITSVDYEGRTCALRTSGGTAVGQGFVALSFRGERWVITGGRAPHKESSSGKVYATPFPALAGAPDAFDAEAFGRSLGTTGGGNHFLEASQVEKVLDKAQAAGSTAKILRTYLPLDPW